ncbi:hypothetical protein Rwratislav_40635 [Rhodococcus wratislaviensis IFP 2016]|nr:hypothetical protein Rwratislav_40635 [Rhodococcus wratislaviensis IFP 2016]
MDHGVAAESPPDENFDNEASAVRRRRSPPPSPTGRTEDTPLAAPLPLSRPRSRADLVLEACFAHNTDRRRTHQDAPEPVLGN